MHGQNTVEPGGKVNVRLASTQAFVTFKGTVNSKQLNAISSFINDVLYVQDSSLKLWTRCPASSEPWAISLTRQRAVQEYSAALMMQISWEAMMAISNR